MGSYEEQIAGMVDDSADTLKIENITDTLNLKADMYAVDEYFDETSKERLQVMLSVKIVDNGGRTLSGRMAEAHYLSSHKIQKQYTNSSTGVTISVHIIYLDKLEPYIGGAMKHEPELKNENMKMIQRNQERLDQHRHQLEQKFCQRRDTSSSRSRQRAENYKWFT